MTFGPRTSSRAALFFGRLAEASGAPSAPSAEGEQGADEVPGHHPVVPLVGGGPQGFCTPDLPARPPPGVAVEGPAA